MALPLRGLTPLQDAVTLLFRTNIAHYMGHGNLFEPLAPARNKLQLIANGVPIA